MAAVEGLWTGEPVCPPPEYGANEYIQWVVEVRGGIGVVVASADLLCVRRTLAENVALFDQAGLELVHVHPLRRLVSVMELKKKP